MEFLYHYYDQGIGPFVKPDATQHANAATAHRFDGFVRERREQEDRAREIFLNKGGTPVLKRPYTMIVGACPWLMSWYRKPAFLRIPIGEFDKNTLSFTYGDIVPALVRGMSPPKDYTGKVYTYEEILAVIQRLGLPQVWNELGRHGPIRYIETQVWAAEPVKRYKDGKGASTI